MQTIVVLGTGTGIGKTYASTIIIDLLVGHFPGAVMGIKPVESGVQDPNQSDASILGAHSRPTQTPQHAFALNAPVSPHLAAELEGKDISVNAILTWVLGRASTIQTPSAAIDWLVLETAGGAFSPLNPTETNATLAAALDPSICILVAPDRLGVLHDLRATLIALEKVTRRPDLIVLDTPEVSDSSTGTNRKEIERLKIADIAGVVGRNTGFNHTDESRLLEHLRVRVSQAPSSKRPK
jgi:dethiobiotin synthetase